MKGKAFSSMREAINATATGNGCMKTIAADLDWSPSEYSRRTTLGEDNSLTFPADDRLIRLQELTGDHSILATMADRLGFEVHPKRDHLPEILASIAKQQADLTRTFEQLKIMVPLADAQPAKRSRP